MPVAACPRLLVGGETAMVVVEMAIAGMEMAAGGVEMAVRVMEGRFQAEDTVAKQILDARRQLLLDLNAQE